MERRKIYGTIIGIVCFVILMLGVTYAYFYWASNPTDKTNVNLTVTKGLEGAIVYKQGTSVLETAGVSLEPSDSYTDGLNATIEFWKRPSFTNPIYGQISFEMLKLQSVFGNTNSNIGKTDTIKWVVTSYTSENTNETVVAEGTFNGKKEGEKFALVKDIELNTIQTFYKIYVWYDASADDPSLPIGGELLSVEISAAATDVRSHYGASPDAVLASLGLDDDVKATTPDLSIVSPVITAYSQDVKISQDVSSSGMNSTISGNRTLGTGVIFDSKTGKYTLSGTSSNQSYNASSVDKYTCNSALTSCDTVYKIISVNVNSATTNYSEAAWAGYTPDLTSNSDKAVGTSYTFNGATGRYTLSGTVYTNVSYSGDYNSGSTSEYYTCITSSTSCSVLYKYTLANVSGTTILDSQRKQTTQNFNYITKADIYTAKGSEFNQSDIGLFAGEDEFGTTYYFRGNVENNYVKFGVNSDGKDMYWRIIRINGDGSVRMIYDGTQAYANGVKSSDRQLDNVKFNDENCPGPYCVGYMYGEEDGIVSYNRGIFTKNDYDSIVKQFIDNWYDDNLSEFENYIEVNAGFCADRQFGFYEADMFDSFRVTYSFDSGAANNIPTFFCENQETTGLFTNISATVGNNKLKNPIGLITADEVMFGGAVIYDMRDVNPNSNFYLYTGYSYWTISPDYAQLVHAYNTGELIRFDAYNSILSNEGMIDYGQLSELLGVKPVINLKADALKSGTGTMVDPFKITY